MVMPINEKEFDNFFSAISWPKFVQNCEFRFSSKMPNFAISFVFRPKRISCVLINVVSGNKGAAYTVQESRCE